MYKRPIFQTLLQRVKEDRRFALQWFIERKSEIILLERTES